MQGNVGVELLALWLTVFRLGLNNLDAKAYSYRIKTRQFREGSHRLYKEDEEGS